MRVRALVVALVLLLLCVCLVCNRACVCACLCRFARDTVEFPLSSERDKQARLPQNTASGSCLTWNSPAERDSRRLPFFFLFYSTFWAKLRRKAAQQDHALPKLSLNFPLKNCLINLGSFPTRTERRALPQPHAHTLLQDRDRGTFYHQRLHRLLRNDFAFVLSPFIQLELHGWEMAWV